MYNKILASRERIQQVVSFPTIEQLSPKTVAVITTQYNEIQGHIHSIVATIRTLCERICGILLRPDLIDLGKCTLPTKCHLYNL